MHYFIFMQYRYVVYWYNFAEGTQRYNNALFLLSGIIPIRRTHWLCESDQIRNFTFGRQVNDLFVFGKWHTLFPVKDKSQQFFPSLSNIPLYLLKLTHPPAILLPNSVCARLISEILFMVALNSYHSINQTII